MSVCNWNIIKLPLSKFCRSRKKCMQPWFGSYREKGPKEKWHCLSLNFTFTFMYAACVGFQFSHTHGPNLSRTSNIKMNRRQYASKQNGFITLPRVNIYLWLAAVHSTVEWLQIKGHSPNFWSTCQFHHCDTQRCECYCASFFFASDKRKKIRIGHLQLKTEIRFSWRLWQLHMKQIIS